MLHPQRILARRLSVLIAIAMGIAACQNVETAFPPATKTYDANDIDVNLGTVRGVPISTIVDEDVMLRGFVKTSPKGNAIMFLSDDKDKIDSDSFRDCINLIIDRKIGFKAVKVSAHTFVGRFVLVERLDPSDVYLTHQGIRFSTDCQAFRQPDSYPYFFVRTIEN